MTWFNTVKGCFLVWLVLSAVCGGGKSAAGETVAEEPTDLLIGVWLKAIAGTNGFDGLQFDADGRVHYLNMFTIKGDRWQRVGEAGLNISSHTERYPGPEIDQLVIKVLTTEQLVLVPIAKPDADGLVYYRAASERPADRMVGHWDTGQHRFFDVTPEDDGYRIVEKKMQEIHVMKGWATLDGMIVETGERSVKVTLVPGSETGRDDWQDKIDCVKIEDVYFLCR